MKKLLFSVCLIGMLMGATVCPGNDWKDQLRRELPLLGHRNWIVVADSVYPLQTAPGIEIIYVDADQIDVVESVLVDLALTKHVKPAIYTDAEMKFVVAARLDVTPYGVIALPKPES